MGHLALTITISELLGWSIAVAALIVLLLVLSRLKRLKGDHENKIREDQEIVQTEFDDLEQFAVVAKKTADGVLILDKEGKIEWANDSFYQMAGVNRETYHESQWAEHKTIQELSTYEGIDEALISMEQNRESIKYDSFHTNTKGEKIWTAATLTPIFEDDQLSKIIAIYTDITARKLLEDELQEYRRKTGDSIDYAKHIQESILPNYKTLKSEFPHSFIFHQPKDVVSGDLHWFSRVGDQFVIAAVDCTGHGVPGAFMSLLANEFLHQIVNNKMVTGPDQALLLMDKMVNSALSREDNYRKMKDGMDMAMAAINTKSMFCQFAGAFNPMYLVRENKLTVFDAVPESIGGGFQTGGKEFIAHEFTLKKEDKIYLFTDGLVDQFGGPDNRKFMRTRLKEMLVELNEQKIEMDQQKKEIANAFNDWKGDNSQLDDVLILGLQIP